MATKKITQVEAADAVRDEDGNVVLTLDGVEFLLLPVVAKRCGQRLMFASDPELTMIRERKGRREA